MARSKSTAYLSQPELVGGTIFVIYLLVLPFATAPAFRLLGTLLGVTISSGLQNTIYYYLIFAVTVILFHGLLGRTSRNLAENFGTAVKVLLAGLVALYGLNELVYRLTHALVGNQTNLNDVSISAQIDAAPRTTLLIVIFLAPLWRRCCSAAWCSAACGEKPCGGLSGLLPAVCLFARMAVCAGEPRRDLFLADGAVSGAGTGAGLGL